MKGTEAGSFHKHKHKKRKRHRNFGRVGKPMTSVASNEHFPSKYTAFKMMHVYLVNAIPLHTYLINEISFPIYSLVSGNDVTWLFHFTRLQENVKFRFPSII